MRILVTGSRSFTDRPTVYGALEAEYDAAFRRGEESVTVVHGNAPGADTLARDWAWLHRHSTVPTIEEPHPADWRRGGYAGKQRNYEMVRLGADLVLAFFAAGAGNRGTANCVENAQRWLPDVEIREFWK